MGGITIRVQRQPREARGKLWMFDVFRSKSKLVIGHGTAQLPTATGGAVSTVWRGCLARIGPSTPNPNIINIVNIVNIVNP